MKYLKKDLELKECLEKEWIIANGLGGYSSSTIIGANTRKYHGLLVAPLTPPARRYVILSKVDESVEIGGIKHDIYTNVCKNYIAEGFKYQENFEKKYIPIFTYKVEGVIIKKLVCMQYGKNTVCVMYKIKTADKRIKLTLAPVVNFRDFHTMNTNHTYNVKEQINGRKVKLIIDGNTSYPVYMNVSEGEYIEHQNDHFFNMYYLEEEKRGFFPEENHYVPGRYEIEIEPNTEKEITFVCSLEDNIDEINAKDVINDEIRRLETIIYDSKLITDGKKEIVKDSEEKQLIKDFLIATDLFVVYRPTFKLHTLIAGYHWFLDWGRDALISFEGLILIPRRFDIAKEILLTFIRNIKFGLLPNGYSGFDNRPLYNSVDSSLLLFEQINRYLDYTGDYKFVKEEIYPVLERIIEAYTNGIDLDDNNIYLDEDNLIVSGTDKTQNTWMDAKYGDFAVTPRNGKAVEINSLWYNALKTIEMLSIRFGDKEKAKKYAEMAKNTKKSFESKFYNKRRKCLYDVLGDGKIRPNQLFSLSLTYNVIDPGSDIAKEIFSTVTKKLLNKYGLKTLAKGEEGYIEVYEGNGFKRDMSYHQGITWPWLLGLYNDSFKNIIKAEKKKTNKKELQQAYREFLEKTKEVFKKAMYNEGAVGNISEIYDSKAPYLPKGTIAQGWSIAEIFRIILEEKKEK